MNLFDVSPEARWVLPTLYSLRVGLGAGFDGMPRRRVASSSITCGVVDLRSSDALRLETEYVHAQQYQITG